LTGQRVWLRAKMESTLPRTLNLFAHGSIRATGVAYKRESLVIVNKILTKARGLRSGGAAPGPVCGESLVPAENTSVARSCESFIYRYSFAFMRELFHLDRPSAGDAGKAW
jgi:hypothetical protein